MEEGRASSSVAGNRSMAGTSRGNSSDFTALLLQLSQAHSNQVKDLEYRVDYLEKKCTRLTDIAKQNHDIARGFNKEKKELQKENARLQQRLFVLESQRIVAKEERNNSGSEQDDDVAVLVTQPAPQASTLQDHKANIPEQQSQNQKPVRPNKLAKGKSKKKVRYTELDATEATLGELCSEVIQEDSRANSSHQQSNKRKRLPTVEEVEKAQDVRCDVSEKTRLVDEFMSCSQSVESRETKPARILVPETCMPSVEMESSIDNADNDQFAGGDHRRTTRQAQPLAVPETLAVVGGNQEEEEEESFNHSDFDPPTYASTPLPAPFSERDDLEALASQLENHASPQLKDAKVNKEFVYVRDQRTKSNSEFQRNSIAHDNDETRFLSQDQSRKKGRPSLPRSESQYPVDFSSTQHSPTFCGGEDNNDEDINHENSVIEEDNFQHAPASKPNCDTKTTPVHGSHPSLHSRQRTPQSVLANDESNQSEASMLLLQEPQRTATPRQSNVRGSDVESNDGVQTNRSNWKANPRKRKFQDDDLEFEGENNQDVENKPDSDNKLRRSSRLRVDQERSAISDETYVDVHIPDKENSPPRHSTLPQISTSNQDLDVTTDPGMGTIKGGKMLKQSTLSMFKKNIRTQNASLTEQYNGIGKVNLDSQRDESLAKAIELSLLASFKNNQSTEGLTGGHQDEFKVPSLPHKKKTPGRSCNDVTRRSAGSSSPVKQQQVKSKERGNTSGQNDSTADVLPDSEILFDVIDKKAGPSRLSRKKKRRASPEAGRSAAREDVREVLQEVDEIQEVVLEDDGDDDNNSCADMFDEEDAGDGDKDDAVFMEDGGGGGMDGVRGTSRMGNYGKGVGNQSMGTLQIAQEFDRLPKKPEGPGYKYIDVVRKKDERQKLKAFDCKQCEAFYRDMKLTDAEKAERMKACSRHRGQFSPPSTPDHYWSVGFPDTQTCLQRGYINVVEAVDEQPRKRRTTKYKQLF